MAKKLLKFLIYVFYGIASIITLLLLILPAWDNQDKTKVGIFLTENEGNLDFGFMKNAEANKSTIYQMAVYTVIYLLIVTLLSIAVIAMLSLDSSKVTKWLHVILCIAHATGLVFLFLIYSIRYISQLVAPLRNFYLTLFGILIDFILILLLIMYKKRKNIEDTPISEVKIDQSDSIVSSKKSTIKYSNSKNQQLISEGIATPLYQNGAEIVEHQPSVKPAPVDQTKIVVSDNIVGNETYMDGNGNQFQYNAPQPVEVATAYAQPANNNIGQSPVFNPVNQSPVYNQVNNANNNNDKVDNKNNHKLVSEYTFAESNPYPVASDTVYNKIPEIPVIGKKDETK